MTDLGLKFIKELPADFESARNPFSDQTLKSSLWEGHKSPQIPENV